VQDRTHAQRRMTRAPIVLTRGAAKSARTTDPAAAVQEPHP